MGNIVNGDDGYMIAGNNFGPRVTVSALPERERPEEWMWPTTKWTSFVAVMWDEYAAGKDLKRVYRSNIVTPDTKDLMASALLKINRLPSDDLGDDLPRWPGLDFVPGDDPTTLPRTPQAEAFLGLLGSSHAAGPAYLGVQYRAIFGKKRINKIKIWRHSYLPTQNMLLYFEDL